MLAGRIGRSVSAAPDAAARFPRGPIHPLQQLNFDVVNVVYPSSMATLLKFVPVSRLLLGSDHPYGSGGPNAEGLRKLGIFSDAQLMAIERDNALRLILTIKA